jgi:hypothetical protein
MRSAITSETAPVISVDDHDELRTRRRRSRRGIRGACIAQQFRALALLPRIPAIEQAHIARLQFGRAEHGDVALPGAPSRNRSSRSAESATHRCTPSYQRPNNTRRRVSRSGKRASCTPRCAVS